MADDSFATYIVKTSCHDPDYDLQRMKRYFYARPHLARLITNYFTEPEITIDHVLNCPQDLTFIAILNGHVQKNAELQPLFILNEKQRWDRASQTDKPILLTKDYYQFLAQHFDFQITSIECIFFYKICPVLNNIFQNLVHQRTNVDITPNKKQLLKNIVNYSAGFFGFNQNKQSSQMHRIVTQATKHYDPTKHSFNVIGSVENDCYLIKTTYKYRDPLRTKQKACQSAFPLYVSIVEFGKLRMSQILTFFDAYLMPCNYRHLYTNIDNVIIAISTPTIDAAVKPHLKNQYEIEKAKYLHPTLPGHLKIEFEFSQDKDWKFVSPMMQNHAIITNDINLTAQKNSHVRYVSSIQAYNYSCKLLDSISISIPQTRRVNKLINTKVQQQTFVLKLDL